MHGESEQTLKRRRTDSNLQDNDEKSTLESDGVSADETQMADVKKSFVDYNNNVELTEGDVYTQLTNTEHDLALAKDIGEALLAENIDLREKYENLLEEHASQVEVGNVLVCLTAVPTSWVFESFEEHNLSLICYVQLPLFNANLGY